MWLKLPVQCTVKLKLGEIDLSCVMTPEISMLRCEKDWKKLQQCPELNESHHLLCNLLNALIFGCPIFVGHVTWRRSWEMFLRTKAGGRFCIISVCTELLQNYVGELQIIVSMMLFKTSIIYWFVRNSYLLMTLRL